MPLGTARVAALKRPAFNPLRLGTDLRLWLSAMDAGDFTLDVSAVTQWNDKSGNGRHYAQSDSAQKPVRNTTAFNSRPGVVFDGTNDLLEMTSPFIFGLGAHLIVMAVKAAGQSFKMLVAEGNTGTITPICHFARTGVTNTSTVAATYRYDNNTIDLDSTETEAVSPTGIFDDTPNILSIIDTGTIWSAALDGTVGSTTASYARSTTTLDIGCIGAQRRGATEESYFAGTIAEVIVSSNFSTTARQNLEQYLSDKWNL